MSPVPVGGQFGQGETAPDLIHPVIGFRCWTVDGDKGMLRSQIAPLIWDAPQASARCLPVRSLPTPNPIQRWLRPHSAPGHKCSCGIHAYYEPRVYDIGGAVKMWGRMEVHRNGMRAEHARILALLAPITLEYRPLVRQFADEWGIPYVRNQEELQAVAFEHGEPMPESLRPQRPAY